MNVSLWSKCSIIHHFYRSHGSSFRCRFGHKSGPNGAPNYAPFFEVAQILILVPFGHKSGPNGAPDMFVQCEDGSLRSLKESVGRFLASNIKCMCHCAQNDQLCTIFRGRTDPHFGAVFVIYLEKWHPRYVCAMRRCVIEVIKVQP